MPQKKSQRFTDQSSYERYGYCGTRTNARENQHPTVSGYFEVERKTGRIFEGRFNDSQDSPTKTIRSGKLTRKSIEFIARDTHGWAIKVKAELEGDKYYRGEFTLPKYDGKIQFQIFLENKDITIKPNYGV